MAIRPFSLTAIVMTCLLAIVPPIDAKELKPIPLEGPALFAEYGADAGDNISGVVCLEGRHCLIVADELIAIQRIRLTADLGGYSAGETFENKFRKCVDPGAEQCPEWDLEALARDGNRLFATGSMGFKRKKIRFDPNRWVFAEIGIDGKGRPTPTPARVQANLRRLGTIFQGHNPDITVFLDKPLQCGGLNVEGLAHIGRRFYFGLRSPSERRGGRAYILSTSADAVFMDDGDLKSQLHVLDFKQPNGMPVQDIGLRALEQLGNDLLIVTGAAGVREAKSQLRQRRTARICRELPEAYNNLPAIEDVPARLWLWRIDGSPHEIGVIGGDYAGKKLEGVGVIARRNNRVDLLLTFDDPGGLPALAVLKNISFPAIRSQ